MSDDHTEQTESLAAERGLIGTILLDRDVIPDLKSRPGDFYHHKTADIYGAMLNLEANGLPITISMLHDTIDHESYMEAVGISSNAQSPRFAPQFDREIIELSVKRSYAGMAAKIAEMSFNGTGPIEIAEYIREHGEQLEQRASDVGIRAPGSIAGWAISTGDQIRNPEDLPPMRKILGDVLPDQGVVVFHGKPGTMKSMILMDAVMCLVSGSDWLPPMDGSNPKRHNLKATKTRCMWLDMDQGRQTTEARLSALRNAHAPFDPDDLMWLSMPDPKFVADSDVAVKEIVSLLLDRGVKVLVIDNLSNIRGKESLNDDGMSRILENIRRIADGAQCLVVIVHHDAKNTGDFFGSVFIDANLDYRYHVERFDNSDSVKVTTTKSRHSAPAGDLIATFDYTHIGTHGQLQSARMYATQEPSNEELDDNLMDTLKFMKGAGKLPASKTAIADAHKELGNTGRRQTVLSRIGDLIANGIIKHTENSSNGYPMFDFHVFPNDGNT